MSHESIKNRLGTKTKPETPVLTPAAAEMIRPLEAKKTFGRQDVDNLIDSLTRVKESAPTMTITLAAPATSDVKQALASWCRSNITPDVLINFQYNRTILGGMVVRSGSHIFDWSFRRQLLNSSVNFREVLGRV